jgi:hypothetical protein
VVFPNQRFASVGGIIPASQFPGTAGIYTIFHPRQIVFGFPIEACTAARRTTSDPEVLRNRRGGVAVHDGLETALVQLRSRTTRRSASSASSCRA